MDEFHAGQPIFVQIRQRLMDMILRGSVAEGDALPSIRQVSTELSVNPLTVTRAFEALVEIGTELAAGRIENALGRLEAAQQQYRAWAELDQAIIDIQEAVHDRKNTLAVQQILTELVGTILGNALRTGMH